jgi:hypothetical protein
VGDHAPLDGELTEHVPPRRQQAVLLGSGFNHERAAPHRQHRGERVAFVVAHRAQAGVGAARDLDHLQARQARW